MALKITNVKPMFTGIITTMDKYTEDCKQGSLIDSTKTKGTIKEYQTVVAVGPNARVQVGDKVMINPARYAKVLHKHKPGSLKEVEQKDTQVLTYSFDVININGVDHLLLQDSDVMYVFEGEEIEDNTEINKGPSLIIPDKSFIV